MSSSIETDKARQGTRMRRAVAVGVSALAIATLSLALSAQEADDLLGPFTAGELANWTQDRTFPTGGFESVPTFQGRDDVARIGIDSAEVNTVSVFNRTEGVQSTTVAGDGDAVQVDLFIDPAWQGNATRAGLWVFDQDFPDTSAYGIIEFANVRPPVTGAPGTGWTEGSEPFEGFRIWDSEAPVTMVNLPNVDFTYGEWVTFRIEVDPVGHVYRYLIDGVEVAVVSRGAAQGITQVILNSFNFGANEFQGLTTESYDAHWSQTPPPEPSPTTTTTQPPPPPPPTSTPPVIPPEDLSVGDEDPGGPSPPRGAQHLCRGNW